MNEQAQRSGRDVGGFNDAVEAAKAGNGTNGSGVGPDAGTMEPNSATAAGTAQGVESERVRLDDAMRRADELLVDSLRRDETRRQRRRRKRNITLILGGLIMTAILCVLLAVLAGQGNNSDSDKAEALSKEGWQLWQQRKLPDAEAKFAEAVKLDAHNANAYNGLGWAQLNQGKSDEALVAFKKTVEIEPEHPAALNGIGQAYLAKGDLDGAEKPLLKAAAHDASAAWHGLARLYLAKGDFDRALPWALLVAKDPQADEIARKMLDAARERKLDDKLRQQLGLSKVSPKR